MVFTWLILTIVGVQLRRPLAVRLGIIWGLGAFSNLAGFAGILVQVAPPAWLRTPAAGHSVLLVASGGVAVAILPVFAEVGALTVGRAVRPGAGRRRIAFGAVGIACFSALVFAAQSIQGLNLAAVHWALRWVAGLIAGVGVATMVRESRRSRAQRTVLLLIAAGFAIIALRPLTHRLFESYAVAGGGPSFAAYVTYATSITVAFMAAGATQYAAVFRHLYDASLREARALEEAEAQAASVRRERALARFAVGFGHDVNNIIQALVLCADQVRRRAVHDAGIREAASILHEAARRGQDIGARLIALEERESAACDAIDVAEVLRALEMPLKRLASLHVVEVSVDGGAPPVYVHRVDLERAIVNLVVNARDASKIGSLVRVRMDVRRQTAPPSMPFAVQEWVCVAVEDRGIGVARNKFDELFKPYYTTKGDAGTGLGLSTVRAVMRSARGEVTVESELGVGTVMTLWFPVRAPDGAVA